MVRRAPLVHSLRSESCCPLRMDSRAHLLPSQTGASSSNPSVDSVAIRKSPATGTKPSQSGRGPTLVSFEPWPRHGSPSEPASLGFAPGTGALPWGRISARPSAPARRRPALPPYRAHSRFSLPSRSHPPSLKSRKALSARQSFSPFRVRRRDEPTASGPQDDRSVNFWRFGPDGPANRLGFRGLPSSRSRPRQAP